MPQAGKKFSSDSKLNGLDHLRSLAITLVFIFHYGRLFPHPEWTNRISKFGWTGVDLFFVLSGYLIASQLFTTVATGNNISLKRFFTKRFFRIIPAYFFVVALYFLFPYIHEREALAPLWKYLTFTQNIGINLMQQGTFSHAWSLCIEEQFYVLMPLILAALVHFKMINKGFWLLIGLFLFGFAIRYYSYQTFVDPFSDDDLVSVYWYAKIYYPTWCRLDGLLAGISIAALFQFKPLLKEKIAKHGDLVLVLSLLALTGAYILCRDEESIEASVFGFPAVAIAYGLLVMAVICPTNLFYRIKSSFTANIATLSYAVYLTHKFVIHITQSLFFKLNIAKDSNLMFLICVATTVTAAFLLNRIIEKPFLKLRDRILYKKLKNDSH